MTTLKIAGITRYSVIVQEHFAATRGLNPDAARTVIWRPERLAHREQLFRAITLPSLDQIAARYSNFRHFILVSADFPSAFKQSLQAIVKPRAWLHIVEVGPTEDFSACKPQLREFVGNDRAFVFRLDDDDALAPAAFLDAVLSHAEGSDGAVMSLDQGFMIRPAWKGVSLVREKIPFVSAGLGIYSRGPEVVSIHDLGNQNKIAEKGYRIIHVRGRLWLRSKTETSDTTMKYWKRWRYWPISESRLQQRLDETFPGLRANSVIDAIIAEVG